MRILIVEDNLEIAAEIERFLAIKFREEIKAKLTVLTVESAISALCTFCPNVILFDVNLPDGSGFDILPHVRDETIVKICMSALPAEKFINSIVQHDVVWFIPKPFDAVDIENAVAKALHLVRERQQNALLEQGLDAKHRAALEELKRLRALVAEKGTKEQEKNGQEKNGQEKDEQKKNGQENRWQNNYWQNNHHQESLLTLTDTGGKAVRTRSEEILFCESEKNYVLVHLENKPEALRIRGTLTDLEKQLSPLGFMRVHKSFLVQIKKAVALSKNSLSFADGRTALVSERNYSATKAVFHQQAPPLLSQK